MDPSLYLYMFLLILCCFNLNTLTDSSSSTQPLLCHEDESSALLQFKRSFVINKFASSDSLAYPKVASWKLGGNTSSSSCCSWDGVECDKKTGHVIGLDLSSSFLYGSIDSNSTLFGLVHLQRLNLANNHFNFSQIPPGIGHLSRLTSLSLASSFFSGQIPSELSSLSNLAFLNLSVNVDTNSQSLLRLEKPSLRDLVQNLSNLRILDLNDVNISATVPGALSNMSSLTTLNLQNCWLYGEFPMGIFRLPNLEILGMTGNENLVGYLPEFHYGNPLKNLLLEGTSFSGMLPNSIGNLKSLDILDLKKCFFYGTIPALLGNLTQLSALLLTSNDLVGQIPSSLLNLTGLTSLDLSRNQLQGMFPSSISQLKHLEVLNLAFNNLSGEVELDSLMELQNLTRLHMSYNKLTVLTSNHTNGTTINKFKQLGFSSCNLRKFPDFLQFQEELVLLFLADNNIHGQIPTWLWNTSKETMTVIDLGYNFLTSSEHLPDVIPWRSLGAFDFSYNMLQGSLPLPPPSVTVYLVAGNLLTGEIPPSFCQSSSLSMLDMSNNYLNGTIPQCLVSSFSDSLLLLNLSSNNLRGRIPPTFMMGIKMIDFSHNQFHGMVPRSLANCTTLQILVLEYNQIEDTFPFWLGALPELEVLILRSNRFHGAIENPKTNLKFPKLCIVDISQNGLSGKLPSEYFKN